MESKSSLEKELKRAQREVESYKIELHQTRGYLHCILQHSTDMIFATDVTGILVSFSKGAEKVLGYALEEVVGRPISDFAEDPEKFGGIMNTCHRDGCSLTLDFHFKHKTGSRIHCHASVVSLTNREGKVVGTIGVCTDITQWKKLQDDLVQVDRLAEMGRIAAGVAHEINNPLAVISEASGWATEVARDAEGLGEDDRQELTETLKKIASQTRRCRNITHKLLDFTRDSAPSKTEFDIGQLLEDTIDLLNPELKHQPIIINIDIPNRPFLLKSDPRLLEQVFVNITTNAIHAILESEKKDGHIDIGASKKGDQVEITFQDNGMGIPEENRDKMFRLFYTTKPPGKGTGLGLPICKNIIKNLGGDISFESTVGKGTVFFIRLPAV